jgi:hypothetical protein
MPNELVHARSVKEPNTKSQELAEIASIFCKECLGWGEVQNVNDCGYRYFYENVDKKSADTPVPPYRRSFMFQNLEMVLCKVVTWCQTNGYSLHLDIALDGEGDDHRQAASEHCLRSNINASDLRLSIMSACIEATRIRKASRSDVE